MIPEHKLKKIFIILKYLQQTDAVIIRKRREVITYWRDNDWLL